MADKIVIEVVGNTAGLKSLTDEFNKTAKASDNLNQQLLETEKEADKVDKAFKSLKTQIKEAKVEAQSLAEKFGASSKEATAAAQRVANLTDDLDDFNQRVKALNPEAKFTALQNVLGGTLGAFQGLTGAVQLFGGESKRSKEIAEKLQGALNFAQGLNSLMGLKDAFKDLQIVLGLTSAATEAAAVANTGLAVAEGEAAVATTGLTATMMANPIFLVVTAVVALGAAMYALSDDTEEAKVKVDLMTESQKALRAAMNESADAADKLAVAQGTMSNSQALINKTYRDNATAIADVNDKIKENNGKIIENNKLLKENGSLQGYLNLQKFLNEQIAAGTITREKANAILENERKRGVDDLRTGLELLETQKKLDQSNKDLVASAKAKNETTKITVDLIKQEEANRKSEEGQAKAKEREAENKKNAEERKRIAEQELKLSDQLRKQLQENAINEIADDKERINQKRQFANENYALELQRLQDAGATQTEIDLLAAGHTDLIYKLNQEEIKLNENKNKDILAQEEKFQASKVALALKQENDPVKQAQIEMDALDEKYAKLLSNEKLNATERATINNQYQKEQLDITDKVTKAVVDGEKVKQEAQQKTADEAAKSAEKRLQTEMAIKDSIVSAAGSFADIGLDITKQQLNAEEQLLKEQKDKGLISEEQYQKKLNEIKHKADVADKQAAIFKATLDFASALINALKAPPGSIPAVLALTTAVAGANLAKIIATPLPKYQKGTLSVPGVDMGRDSVMAMLQPGEAVIPTAINRKYAPTIRAIYEQKISASDINSFVRGHKKNSSGELVATIDPLALGRVMNKNRTVTVENAQTIGKVIANEIGGRFNNRYII